MPPSGSLKIGLPLNCSTPLTEPGGGKPPDPPAKANAMRPLSSHLPNLAANRYPASEENWRNKTTRLRETITTLMTPAQIAEAQRLAREWKPKK